MSIGVFEVLGIETDGSFGIIWISYLTYKLVIDAKQEAGSLSIHTQEIVDIQTLDALIRTFGESHKSTG